MTEEKLNLLMLRYNSLSKERSEAAYMWGHAGESVCDEAKWDECRREMGKIEEDLHGNGYELVDDGYKVKGKVRYSVYRIVPMEVGSDDYNQR